MTRYLEITVLAAILVLQAGTSFATPTVQVPEPSTMALIAAGIAGLAVARKFRKRK